MTPMRPIVLMLAIVGLASSHAAETTVPSASAPAPAELAPDERPIATTGEPTAKIIATSRKKQVAAKAPAQVLETFPPLVRTAPFHNTSDASPAPPL